MLLSIHMLQVSILEMAILLRAMVGIGSMAEVEGDVAEDFREAVVAVFSRLLVIRCETLNNQYQNTHQLK